MDNVEVKASEVEGLGLFATRFFAAGERIRKVNIVREITESEPLDAAAGERFDHCAYPDGKIFLWGYPDRHVNHSCDPNAYEVYDKDDVYSVARRSIRAGEEITFDYNLNLSESDSWPCHCGAKRCRKETIGDYFKLPRDIQYEYRPLLADWFVRRYKNKVKGVDSVLSCPFCDKGQRAYGEVIYETSYSYMLTNPDPVLTASVMIMPIRHARSPLELSDAEWQDIKSLLSEAKTHLEQFQPDGFNIGWNVGDVGGQHVEHAHLHVIGRFADEPLAGKGIRHALKQPENKRS